MPDFILTENAQVESLEKVPETFRPLYQEGEDGSYSIPEQLMPVAKSYDGMATNFENERKKKKTANDESASRRQQLKQIEELAGELEVDLDSLDGENETLATALRKQIEDLRSQAKNGKDIKVNLDKVKADADKRIKEATEAKDGELKAMQSALHKHMVSDVASRAISAAKGSPELLLPHVERHCKVIRNGEDRAGNPNYEVIVMDADGDARLGSDGSNMTVEQLVAEMKNSDKFGRAFESETPAGTGSTPGTGKTPPARRATQRDEDRSSVDKISAGLKSGKFQRGRG